MLSPELAKTGSRLMRLQAKTATHPQQLMIGIVILGQAKSALLVDGSVLRNQRRVHLVTVASELYRVEKKEKHKHGKCLEIDSYSVRFIGLRAAVPYGSIINGKTHKSKPDVK